MELVRIEGKGVNKVTVYQMSPEELAEYLKEHPIVPYERGQEDYR